MNRVTADLGVVLIGPPGAGKGTQAALLCEEFGLSHIGTGDLLREHRARGTALGEQASTCMAEGQLVPDDLVVAVVREKLMTTRRYLLDGFPRTLTQSHELTKMLKLLGRTLSITIVVEAPDAIVAERIAARGEGRIDDDPETIRRRLDVFRRTTEPVLHFFDALGILHYVNAARPIPDVHGELRRLIDLVAAPHRSPQR